MIFPSVSDLLDLRTVHATWHLGPHAEVRVGDHVTRYVRRGSGPCVVLLGADAESHPLWGPLVASLAGRFRLVLPEIRTPHTESSEWLRGFIEGLGLTSVSIIAAGEFAQTAIDLAATDDFTVGRLVILGTGESTTRIAFVGSEVTPDAGVRRVMEFLTPES